MKVQSLVLSRLAALKLDQRVPGGFVYIRQSTLSLMHVLAATLFCMHDIPIVVVLHTFRLGSVTFVYTTITCVFQARCGFFSHFW